MGEYIQELSDLGTGKLKVSKSSWKIEYYLPGPDYRYNGEFYIIDGDDVRSYIDALKTNWEKYQKLLKTIPKEGEYIVLGAKDMTIRVHGNYFNGICINNHHLPINSEKVLNHKIKEYEKAIELAKKIQVSLKEYL